MSAALVVRRAMRLSAAALAVAACSPGVRPAAAPAPAPGAAEAPGSAPAVAVPAPAPVPPTLPAPRQPIAPPATAFVLGLMPVRSTGVAAWRAAHPAWDGRGVLIGILDSGVDPSVPGLLTTSTGARKILDLRNFSSEGTVPLERVHPDAAGRIALPGGLVVSGAAAVAAVAVDSAWYGGVVRELSYGDAPEADFNGNGSNRDSYGVVVVRSASGWVAFIDTNGDGSLADEKPLADYLVRGGTFTFGLPGAARTRGPITGAVNLSEDASGAPRLSLVLDTAGHGTHVAGIAAGYDIGKVEGFDGVAPGAQIIGLKIADDARGGISTTGSMLRAMEYAVRFAAARRLPLVLNMSFGIGNMEPGAAQMDSVVNAFLLAHPDVVFAIAAGNDGPGAETVGLPGSAALALGVGSLYPGPFAAVQFGTQSPDVLGWWSSRGGALDKPDIVTPGIAYSTVPRWNTGGEIKAGTSMSTPHAAGLVALLVSALAAEGRTATAAQLEDALRASAHHLPGASATDEGYGAPDLEAAYRWLEAGHPASRFIVRAAPPALEHAPVAGMGAAPQVEVARADARPSAAYRRSGFAWPGDTVQWFSVTRLQEPGGPAAAAGAATYRLSSDQPWLVPEDATVTFDAAGSVRLEVRYDRSRLTRPGRYVGSVDAVPVADSTAGPAFRLVSEIVIPDDVTWGGEQRTGVVVAGGRAWRRYLDVPAGASGLAVHAVVPDSTAHASLALFEPGGRPSRTDGNTDVGGRSGTAGTLSVTANDLRPGVWEAVVQALPGDSLHFDFAAAIPPIAIAVVDSGAASPGVTLQSESGRDTTVLATADRIGVETGWVATVEHGGPYRRTFAAPAWATQAVLEVQLTPQLWELVTDFGLTMFDQDGAQLGNSPMNYDFNRLTVDLPEQRAAGYPVTVELFPAFALPTPPASFTAQVRVEFVGPSAPIPLQGAGDTATVALPAHATAAVRLPAFPSLVTAPEWRDLVRIRVMGKAEDWATIERTIAIARP